MKNVITETLKIITLSNMTSPISLPSAFEIPYLKNAKLVKLEIKPLLYNIVYNYTRHLERLIITHNNPHHWLQTDIVQIQNFLYHYFKDVTLNEQTIFQTKLISLFLRKYFRFNYQLSWSLQDQPAFAAFHNHFTADECLPFIINEHNEHPYFVKLDTITKQAIDYISLNPRLITEKIFTMTIDLVAINKTSKNNKIKILTMTMMKMTLIMKNLRLKTKMKMTSIMKNMYMKIKMEIVMKI